MSLPQAKIAIQRRYLIQFLQQVQGYTALDASVRLLPSTMGVFVAAPFAGVLTARIGPRLPVVVGALLCTAAFFLEGAIVEPGVSYATLWWRYAIFGLGGARRHASQSVGFGFLRA